MSEPTLRAILFADGVCRQVNGKWVVVGIYDRIFAAAVPVVHASAAYLAVVDVPPKGFFRIDVKDPRGATIWSTHARPYELGRGSVGLLELGIVGIVIHLRTFGRHAAEVYVDDAFVGAIGLDFQPAPGQAVRA